MGRGLDGSFDLDQVRLLDGCAAFRARPSGVVSPSSVALAWGKHLFPFRTEKLSPTAPMVLDPYGSGRVGRRRFTYRQSRTTSRLRAARRR
jgi:hypothetical protein